MLGFLREIKLTNVTLEHWWTRHVQITVYNTSVYNNADSGGFVRKNRAKKVKGYEIEMGTDKCN